MIDLTPKLDLTVYRLIERNAVLHWKKILIVCLFLGSPCALGLSSDRKSQIHVQADSATIDEARGTYDYEGKVVIKQGTLLIQADRVHIIKESGEVVQIVASSTNDSDLLAHYEQQPNDDEQLVMGEARQITYMLIQEHLLFEGKASLKQTDKASFSAEVLSYDIAKGIVNLDRGEEQVIMTLNPSDPGQ